MTNTINPIGIPNPSGVLGYDGSDYRAVLLDSSGNLQVNVINMITDLAELLNALKSVGTDQLIVKGQDQLHSFKAAVYDHSAGNPSAANGFRSSSAVPANTVWHVTVISGYDGTRALTQISFNILRGAQLYAVDQEIRAIAINERAIFTGDLWLESGDLIRTYYVGSQAADNCVLQVHGESFTKES